MEHLKKRQIIAVVLVVALLFAAGFFYDPGKAEVAFAADPTPSGEATPTDGGTPTPGAGTTEITEVRVYYDREEIMVKSSKQVYFAVLKKAGETTAKASELKSAAVDATGQYLIDFSLISPSKAGYIGLTTDAVGDTAGIVNVKTVELEPTQKKVTFNIDWSAEGSTAQQTNVIYSVEVVDATGAVTVYKNTPATGEKSIADLNLQWKKGVNGNWDLISTLSAARWKSMLISGTTLYLRSGATNQTTPNGKGVRYGKEVKIKISSGKAPAVKLDVNKLTIALKNGMQFRKKDTTKWETILPFNAKATVNTIMRTDGGNFNPQKESTTAKVKEMTLDDIRKALGMTSADDKKTAFTLEVRTAATTKKPATSSKFIEIPGQTDAPTTTLTAATDGYKVGTITKAESDTTAKLAYEFMVTTIADRDSGLIDFTTVKWSAVKDNTLLKPTSKSSYKLTDGQKKEIKMQDPNAVLLIRRKGIAGGAKAAAVLPSLYTSVTIPALAATVTPTATPTAEPSTSPAVSPTP